MSSVFNKLKEHGVIPEVIPDASANVGFLIVSYPSGAEANLGEELTLTQVASKPVVTLEADPDTQYLLPTLCWYAIFRTEYRF